MSETINTTALSTLATLAPRRLNMFITTGWIDSVTGGRPVNSHGEPIPWFTFSAIDFLEQRINRNWKVLEWGCGNSTLWWAGRVARITSIEHNPQWHREVLGRAPSNAKINLVDRLEDYAAIKGVDGNDLFDLIVIDGEERLACTATAHAVALSSAMIVLDNSDRKSLRPAMEFLRSRGWNRIDFFGLIPCYAYRTCTSIFYRGELPGGTNELPCDFVSSLGPTLSQTLGE